jgi:hypothetical protein
MPPQHKKAYEEGCGKEDTVVAYLKRAQGHENRIDIPFKHNSAFLLDGYYCKIGELG